MTLSNVGVRFIVLGMFFMLVASPVLTNLGFYLLALYSSLCASISCWVGLAVIAFKVR